MIKKFVAAVLGIGSGILAAWLTVAAGLVLLFFLKIALLIALVVGAVYVGRMAGTRVYWKCLAPSDRRPDQVVV
jgi:hypothetical protein